MLTLSGQVAVQLAIRNLEDDSRIVNIAGRQRMLSQRIVRLILELGSSDISSTRLSIVIEELSRLSTDWTSYHQLLQNGSEDLDAQVKNTPAILKLFTSIEPHFQNTKSLVNQFLSERKSNEKSFPMLSTQNRQDLISNSDAFLFGMDEIVLQYEVESRKRVERLRSIEAGLVTATLIVLVCEGLFIFSPAVRSLRKSFRQIQTVSEQLQNAKLVAESANLAKTQFLTRLSHELRTPLHAILGMLSLIQRTNLTKNQKYRIKLTHAATQSLRYLVDDLLDVSSIEQGDYLRLTPKPMLLIKFIEDCVALMQPVAVKKGLTIEYQITSGLPLWISQDRHRLRQVIINLLQNAIRYTASGSIIVQVNPGEDFSKPLLKIAVVDTGTGIANESLTKIFENFSRLDEGIAVNSFGRGLGLGLPITRALVEKMGGHISVESQVGFGTTFIITIPMKPVTAPKRSRIVNRKRKNLNHTPTDMLALIIDDAKPNRLLLQGYLRRLGIQAIEADSISNAIEQWKIHRPFLILLDRHLTDGEGFEFIDQLRILIQESEPTRKFPAIFLVTADASSHTSGLVLEGNKSQGIIRILRKPLSLSALRSAFAEANIFDAMTTTITNGNPRLMKPEPMALATGFDSANISHTTTEASSCGSGKTPTPSPRGDPNDFSELQKKLKSMVYESLPGDMSEIANSWNSKNFGAIQKVAHRIAGSAGNAGLMECANLARELESSCQDKDEICIKRAMEKIEQWVEENTSSAGLA